MFQRANFVNSLLYPCWKLKLRKNMNDLQMEGIWVSAILSKLWSFVIMNIFRTSSYHYRVFRVTNFCSRLSECCDFDPTSAISYKFENSTFRPHELITTSGWKQISQKNFLCYTTLKYLSFIKRALYHWFSHISTNWLTKFLESAVFHQKRPCENDFCIN